MLIVAEKALNKQNGMKVENVVAIKYSEVCETSENYFVLVSNISQLQEQ